ncbi:MAG: hypothetical protein ABI678_31690, partial [Kofleriaceae bacterium]
VRAALIAMVLWCSVAQATPREDFDQAKQAYRSGQYTRALPLFNALLYPEKKLADGTETAEAYLALGICRYETGDTPGAKREFEQALLVNSNVRIDPLIVTDTSAIDVFNETRLTMQDRIRMDAERRRREELLKIRESYIGVESHSFLLNFVPFGVGQYQNGDIGKGAFFTATEVAMLGTSVGVWFYLVSNYGLRSTRIPAKDQFTVLHLQQLEIGTGLAFYGLWVWGAIDAYLHFQPQVRIELDESALPPELRGLLKPEKTRKKPPKTSLRLAPMLTPDSVGIGLSWEN